MIKSSNFVQHMHSQSITGVFVANILWERETDSDEETDSDMEMAEKEID